MTTDTTTTVQLTDTQLAQFTACGLIVVEGERAPSWPADESCSTCDWGHCNQQTTTWRWDAEYSDWLPVCAQHATDTPVAPELWRKLTEPCATCGGEGWIAGHGTDCPVQVWCDDPDCAGGRQVVTLTATCPKCYGRGWTGGLKMWGPCQNCERRDGAYVVILGRFTIRLLPFYFVDRGEPHPGAGNCIVVAPSGVFIERPTETRNTYFTLDPLPRPGQWAVAFEAVAQ